MKRKRLYILITILILIFSSMACGLFNGGDEASTEVLPTEQSADNIPSDNPATHFQPKRQILLPI